MKEDMSLITAKEKTLVKGFNNLFSKVFKRVSKGGSKTN
jgi:hypothetical protein